VVDDVATHLVGDVLRDHRAATTPLVRTWATDADPWVRRTAVICQVGHGAETDLDLLRHAVESNLADTSFWLRKAIGWALRDQARTDPGWVRAEVDRLGDRMSGLSRREATKHL
jgi:3-methyladenine DNA glycosylase AlkD